MGLISLSLLLAGCGSADLPVVLGGGVARPTPPPQPTARAIASGASRVLVPYRDSGRTYEMRRPQTWIVMDARTAPRFARALGDGVRFFEPITASDPDAGSAGKLWVEVLPVRPGSTPRQVLLAPFVASDYPAGLLKRMHLAPTRLGGVPAYRLVTLASKTQATILLARWRDHYYRLTIFSPTIPAEVARALRTWRFTTPPQPDRTTTPTPQTPVRSR